MRGIGIALCLALTWGLGGCFVQHAALIGAAEPVVPQQWSGGWVAEPLESGGEPGFFVVADVDPATGAFTVSAADADGDAMDDPIALHLRRVGDTLFLDAREKDDDPWMLFVVSEMTADRIVLAWKPQAAAFQRAVDMGALAGHVVAATDATPAEFRLADFTVTRQEKIAREWQALFTSERLILRRMADTD